MGPWLPHPSERRIEAPLEGGHWPTALPGTPDVVLTSRRGLARWAPGEPVEVLLRATDGRWLEAPVVLGQRGQILVTELRTEQTHDGRFLRRGALVRVPLDGTAPVTIADGDAAHFVEAVAPDESEVVVAAFDTDCFWIAPGYGQRLMGRTESWVQSVDDGTRRALPAGDILTLGFTDDDGTVLVAVPEDYQPDARRARAYAIERVPAHEGGRSELLRVTVGLAHGVSEQWGLELAPPGRTVYHQELTHMGCPPPPRCLEWFSPFGSLLAPPGERWAVGMRAPALAVIGLANCGTEPVTLTAIGFETVDGVGAAWDRSPDGLDEQCIDDPGADCTGGHTLVPGEWVTLPVRLRSNLLGDGAVRVRAEADVPGGRRYHRLQVRTDAEPAVRCTLEIDGETFGSAEVPRVSPGERSVCTGPRCGRRAEGRLADERTAAS